MKHVKQVKRVKLKSHHGIFEPGPDSFAKMAAATIPTLQTPLTQLLGIQHPIMLAGMNGVSHSDLAAAVSNAGRFLQIVAAVGDLVICRCTA